MDAPNTNLNYPTSYRLGCGRRREIPQACREHGMNAPLVIADPGLVELPWFTEIVDLLRADGLDVGVFSDLQGNPVEGNVVDGVSAYKSGGHDGCVLVGGGSAMDVGKCVALMVGQTGQLFDYEDVGDNWTRVDPDGVAPMIACPTTSGTGSEVGRASVITDPRDHTKKIIFHPRMLPPLVVADPETTFGLPPGITAATGIDAFVHAFEALCAPGYHPLADGIALEGMRLVKENLPSCVADGKDAVARTHMMMASSMGATAFQKGLGLVHALAHPLGAETGIHHGLANAILLPYAMLHNHPAIGAAMDRLARHLELPGAGFDAVLAWVQVLRERVGIPATLAEAGFPVSEELARKLAPKALADAAMGTNPKTVSEDEVTAVFVQASQGEGL